MLPILKKVMTLKLDRKQGRFGSCMRRIILTHEEEL